VLLVFSTIYVLPIAWTTLAVRRHLLAVLLTALVAAPFAALLLLSDSNVDPAFARPMEIGFICGAFLTAPGSLLASRLFGYRLARIRRDDATPTDQGNA
jgi:hypothetical protein